MDQCELKSGGSDPKDALMGSSVKIWSFECTSQISLACALSELFLLHRFFEDRILMQDLYDLCYSAIKNAQCLGGISTICVLAVSSNA